MTEYSQRRPFSELILSKRVDLDITQKELARAAGISSGLVDHLEKDRKSTLRNDVNTSNDTKERIAWALGLGYEEIGLDIKKPSDNLKIHIKRLSLANELREVRLNLASVFIDFDGRIKELEDRVLNN